MLLLSCLPQIIAQEFLGVDLGPQMLWLWLAVGAVLIAGTLFWATLPLRGGYFGVLTALYAATVAPQCPHGDGRLAGLVGGIERPGRLNFFGVSAGSVAAGGTGRHGRCCCSPGQSASGHLSGKAIGGRTGLHLPGRTKIALLGHRPGWRRFRPGALLLGWGLT